MSSIAAVVNQVPKAEDSVQKLLAEIAALREANAKLAAKHTGKLAIKVSDKGGVSVYGLGRFPVTLYQEQWTRLLDVADEIRAFIKANQATLKTKGE